ncbi:glycoside hydrolase family 108 protein [Campylobacter hyointestinalis]|uniref:glycoside hydrolase family 108 protein n=1 Tax=Campylobacter hyointestinalis TaxID=198 RepID=UPI000DCC774E|nr:glycosyl hydrolase 108 family protein [Campylobacter hyointestinalis]RAZ38051.1 peptidoglycan domain protein [Campylobacter hyointestinalis subsp. lawsonii]RAZ54644.1 peptidoglycan domain protein [Campylobacter hyointestinalis subsp. lawsonii]RAZ63372.1 peptidoglycan domain protein [Campylobacter hyointestinalis subsp. lawsonii]
MADFYSSMKLLKRLEFSNPKNCLHKNATEDEITYFGIYKKANPKWSGWQVIDETLQSLSISEASKSLYENEWLTSKVYQFYLDNFWHKLKLDKIDSQKIADEIFCFGCNAGIKTAIKLAQKALNLDDDGIIGENTLNALNSCDESEFDLAFDDLEMEYYDKLIAKNPKLAIYQKGWYNRAKAV